MNEEKFNDKNLNVVEEEMDVITKWGSLGFLKNIETEADKKYLADLYEKLSYSIEHGCDFDFDKIMSNLCLGEFLENELNSDKNLFEEWFSVASFAIMYKVFQNKNNFVYGEFVDAMNRVKVLFTNNNKKVLNTLTLDEIEGEVCTNISKNIVKYLECIN